MRIYRTRDKALRSIGYRSYPHYLASHLWASIRLKVYRRDGHLCRLCSSSRRNVRAQVVHHLNYRKATLLGKSLKSLVSLCHACHEFLHKSGCEIKIP